MLELSWKDIDADKRLLNEHYPGSAEKGSPLFQYLLDRWGKGLEIHMREQHLTTYERSKYFKAIGYTGVRGYPSECQLIVHYREYQYPGFSSEQQTQPTVIEDQESVKSQNRGRARKRKGRRRADPTIPKRRRSWEPTKEGVRLTVLNRRETRRIKQLLRDQLIFPPHVEARLRSLRPRNEARKRGKTGKIHCTLPK